MLTFLLYLSYTSRSITHFDPSELILRLDLVEVEVPLDEIEVELLALEFSVDLRLSSVEVASSTAGAIEISKEVSSIHSSLESSAAVPLEDTASDLEVGKPALNVFPLCRKALIEEARLRRGSFTLAVLPPLPLRKSRIYADRSDRFCF